MQKSFKSAALPNCIYLLPALGLYIYLFHPLFWSSVIDNDMTTYFYYFFKKLFFSELQNGELPLWNPGVALGYYQAGNPLHGYFYPLNIVFFLLPFDLAYNWLILVHYLLAGLFMYLLVKALTGNSPASLFSGVAYAFSGVMISLSKNIGFLFGAVWYPLILFSLEKYLHSRKYSYLGLLTLAFSCQFLSGDLQGFAIVVGLAAIQILISSRQTDPIRKAPARFALSLGRNGLALAGALALALGLAMVQLLPLLDMAGQSYRLHGIPLEEAGYFSFNPQRLFNLFHPYLWGHANFGTFWGENLSNSLTMKQFWYPSVYLGIAPILLALCSLLKNRQISPSPSPSPLPASDGTSKGEVNNKRLQDSFCNSSFVNRQSSITRGLAIWYFILIIVFFFLACGSFTPVWPWIYTHLPVFSLFRFPAKYFSVVNFLLCILAGLGLANILSLSNDNHPHPNPPPSPPPTGQARRRGIKWAPFLNRNEKIVFGGMAALAIAVFSLLLFKYSGFRAEIASHPQINTPRALSELRQGYISLALFSAAAVLLILFLALARERKNYLLFALFLLLGTDLFLSLPPLKATSREDFHLTPEIYSRVLSREEPHSYRLWFDSGSVPFFQTGSYRELLVPNSALDYGVDYFFGNEPALPGRTYELYRFDNLGNLAELLNLADTRYVLTNVQQSGKSIMEIYPRLSGLKPVFTDPGKNVLLLRNENARPRFYVVNQWEWVPSGREAFQKTVSPGTGPGRPVIIEGNECLKAGKIQKMGDCRDRTLFPAAPQIPPFPPLPKGGEGGLKVIKYSPNRIDLEAGLPSPALLIFNDAYYPGWRALVDGQDREIYRVNYLFKGIFLPAGGHRVSFLFRPASYRWGRGITLFSLLACLLLPLAVKKANARKNSRKA